jgi:hypothetical protein
MIDEMDVLYETVGLELKRGEERPGIMARATAEANGNPEKAKSLYIRYRVAELAEDRHRESEKTAKDETELFPEISAEARNKIPGFDALSSEDKLRKYSTFETPDRLYLAGYLKHSDGRDIDGAIRRYRRVIQRFPDGEYARYAQQQLDNLRGEGTLGVHPPMEIQALLAQQPSIDSCEEILTLLGYKVTRQETGKWTVLEPRGSRRFLYSFNELESYTSETAAVALKKAGMMPTEPPVIKSDEPFKRFSDLARPTRPGPNPVGRQSASQSEIESSKQSAFDQQPTDYSRQPSVSEKTSDSDAKAGNSKEVPTHWLWFYTYIWLPFSLLISALLTFAEFQRLEDAGYQIDMNPLIYVPTVLCAIFACFLIYGLHKRRFWGWVCNWIFLGMFVFFNTAIFNKPFEVYIGTTVLLSLVFFLPNYFYFKRRRSLFSRGN